jgi:hypothetical protein
LPSAHGTEPTGAGVLGSSGVGVAVAAGEGWTAPGDPLPPQARPAARIPAARITDWRGALLKRVL